MFFISFPSQRQQVKLCRSYSEPAAGRVEGNGEYTAGRNSWHHPGQETGSGELNGVLPHEASIGQKGASPENSPGKATAGLPDLLLQEMGL